MRLPLRKQPTAYAKPDVLDRARLGISPQAHSQARAPVGTGAEDCNGHSKHTRWPAQDNATALRELEHLREAALVEIGAPPGKGGAAQPEEARAQGEHRRLYVPLRARVLLTFLAGAVWMVFSTWLSRHWIAQLGRDLTVPVAIAVISGIALIPGYLN